MKARMYFCRSVAAALLLAVAVTQWAHAAYPEKPIRWIVPSAAGGASDVAARIVTAHMTTQLGQPFVIENRPGAAGVIGLDAIAKSVPDGYTIGTASLSSIVTGTMVAKNPPYQVLRDFSPIGMINTMPNLLGVNAKLPVRSVAELVTYSKAHPNELFYGSNGNGSSLHVATELFRSATGLKATHVPYKSTPAAETDLIAGQTQLMIDNFSTMAPNVLSGRIRALAITSAKRSPTLPNVPTMSEIDLPTLEMSVWSGVVGPAKLPQDIVRKLNAAMNAALADPKVIRQLAELACEPAPMSPEQFDQFLKSETARWGAVIRANHITGDD